MKVPRLSDEGSIKTVRCAEAAVTLVPIADGPPAARVREEHGGGTAERLSMGATAPADAGRRILLGRLNRIEGQVRGLQRMVQADAPYADVCTQIAAVTHALNAVALSMLDEHLRRGVVDAQRSSSLQGQQKVAEAVAAVARLTR